MSGDILVTIDKALDDYETSDDAMRWTPEPAAVRPRAPINPDFVVRRPLSLPSVRITLDMTALRESLRRTGEDLQRLGEAVRPGLAKMGEQLTASLKPMQVAAHRRAGHADRLARIRCRICNPRGNPRPSLHGAAYRRRQLAGRRRQ